jgi:hypothetical protein
VITSPGPTGNNNIGRLSSRYFVKAPIQHWVNNQVAAVIITGSNKQTPPAGRK